MLYFNEMLMTIVCCHNNMAMNVSSSRSKKNGYYY